MPAVPHTASTIEVTTSDRDGGLMIADTSKAAVKFTTVGVANALSASVVGRSSLLAMSVIRDVKARPVGHPSAPDHLLQMLWVPSAVNRERRRRAIDLAEIIRRQANRGRAKVLLEPMALRRTRNGYDPRLLRQ
jgi:hypothetical protein